jgi:multiple sugar transport system permease protein
MSRGRQNWAGYLFVAPATLYLLTFSFIPMGLAIWLSLHRWNLLKSDHPFVGWNNYREALADPFFRNACWNTFRFALMSVPAGMIFALAVAILVNQKLRGMAFFRTLFYIPAVSSGVAISMVWLWILMPQDGLINRMVRLFGGEGATDFLNSTTWAMPALVLMSMWIGLGPRMVIFLAGLQAIPQSLYEAAEMDGAGPWRRFWHVTVPMLAPTTLFVLVTSTIAAFQLFTQVYIMTRGGPRRTTDVVVYHIYREAWQRFEIGMAAAQSYLLFLAILIVAVLQFWLMRRQLRMAGTSE